MPMMPVKAKLELIHQENCWICSDYPATVKLTINSIVTLTGYSCDIHTVDVEQLLNVHYKTITERWIK